MGFTLGSLFAGFGGIDLGFERAGFQALWQVEFDDYARLVLEANFPNADRTIFDVRNANRENLKRVDVVAGGFPCQDISASGHRAGIGGARSGLWGQMHRVIDELRPKFAVMENVSALLIPERGGGAPPIARVCGDMAEVGYDCEWAVLSACRFGASHMRERVFIVAYPHSFRLEKLGLDGEFAPLVFKELPTASSISIRGSLWEEAELEAVGLVDGVSHDLGAIKGFGNAVVPHQAEWIARRIRTLLESAVG
jgi:DNA (cytosine-5)-methyltransferase 1